MHVQIVLPDTPNAAQTRAADVLVEHLGMILKTPPTIGDASGKSDLQILIGPGDATSDLARGRLVEYSRVAWTTLNLIVIRGGLIALFGVWVLTRRELGTVIRR